MATPKTPRMRKRRITYNEGLGMLFTGEDLYERFVEQKQKLQIVVSLLLACLLFYSYFPAGKAMWQRLSHVAGLEKVSLTAKESPFSIHVLNVGKADAILVCCEGENLLLDTGTCDQGDKISDYLTAYQIKKLDYLVISHPDIDHIGGLAQILKEHGAKTLYLSALQEKFFGASPESLAAREMLENGRAIPHFLKAGDSFSLGGATLRVLAPLTEQESPNDSSLVIKLVYGDFSALFCGEIEKEGEAELVRSGQNLKSDLLKISHHGSKTSTTKLFLNAVQPECAVISVGPDRNQLPSREVLTRLENFQVKVYRTDVDGTVIFTQSGLESQDHRAPISFYMNYLLQNKQ